MSGNHNQSLERALAIVEAAAESGADAVKLQTYTADTMTLDCGKPGFVIEDPTSPWCGRQAARAVRRGPHAVGVAWSDHGARRERSACQCFSTPFDETAVDFLESLDVPGLQDRLVREHRPAR